ncbi:hypothetical protein [Fodinicola acaciae]|nr:hypothetical protein [Fodinicola acaciae]
MHDHTGQGLLVAGHETTTNVIGKMVAMLLADRSLVRGWSWRSSTALRPR